MYSATAALIDWLLDKGYQAHSYPPKSGAEFFTVERTGGSVYDLVDHPTFAIQAWSESEQGAESMLGHVRLMLAQGDVPEGFYRVEANSMYPFYDDETRLPRYQLVINATTQLTKE